MRGRTLDNSFIILDEAQNTTIEQMKMFLTRFGFGSKVIVNGDITQIDLPSGKRSGLVHAAEVLRNVEEIAMVELTDRDVVRHTLVRRIIQEYDKYEKRQQYKDEAKQESRQDKKHRPGTRPYKK
jgi:phosphate starvation-inducible PhoH-like protein